MNPRARIGLTIAIVGVVLIVVGIIAAIRFLNVNIGNPAQAQPTPVAKTTAQVVVAANDVAGGSVLSASDVTTATVPLELVPRDAVNNLDNAVGRIAKADLVQGEMILSHNLANPTGSAYDIAYVLDDKHVLMAVPATDLMSREAMIKRGDIVDILASYQEVLQPAAQTGGTATGTTTGNTTGNNTNNTSQNPQQVTFNAFQRLNITAIVIDIVQKSNTSQAESAPAPANSNSSATSTGPNRDQVSVQAYLIALNPQDALVLKYLKDAGAIFDFVLRAPTSKGQFQLTPVTSQYIKELYGLDLLP